MMACGKDFFGKRLIGNTHRYSIILFSLLQHSIHHIAVFGYRFVKREL